MIDKHGFRLNAGIVLANAENRLFWGRRVGKSPAWQFAQGGIHEGESIEETMYRELQEELGLLPQHVQLLAITENWLSYYIPRRLRRIATDQRKTCIGQTQKWFLLRFIANDDNLISLTQGDSPEFSSWKWVDYWYPAKHIVTFKKKVYKTVLEEFAPILFK